MNAAMERHAGGTDAGTASDAAGIGDVGLVREFGPIAGADAVHGVSHDGKRVWAAVGARIVALDPGSGETVRVIERDGDAGTAFDGTHLWQIAGERIERFDPATGDVVHAIPVPGTGCNSGLAWADGSLWVGQYQGRGILRIDPATGEVLKRIDSDRYVTGVTWLDGSLWHGTWEDEASELRRVDANDGHVLERLRMPEGIICTGLEADAAGTFYCGGGSSGKVRVVRRAANGNA